jgi:hypothetical protein
MEQDLDLTLVAMVGGGDYGSYLRRPSLFLAGIPL